MTPEPPAFGAELDGFRAYLRSLARLHLDAETQQHVDPSDVVQDTLLRAHKAIDQFRGSGERELAAWLMKILANTLADTKRRFRTGKRDIGLERALHAALDDSSARFEKWLDASEPTPSDKAIKAERLLRLAEALEELPDDQREAVTLHHLERQSLTQVAVHMKRSAASVAGLIRRGMVALRQRLDSDE